MIKIGDIQLASTEVTGVWLKLWSGQLLVEGLERVSTTRLLVESHVPQFHP